jgi:hypothetical protein
VSWDESDAAWRRGAVPPSTGAEEAAGKGRQAL